MSGPRTYTLASITWPKSVWRGEEHTLDELSVVVREDGVFGEFVVAWIDLDRRRYPSGATQVQVFSDGWSAFHRIGLSEQLAALNDKDPTPAEFIALLERLGFKPSEYHGRMATTSGSG